jgi:hypothetical protein
LLDEAWNAKPAVLNEPFAQVTGAPIRIIVALVDDAEDGIHVQLFLVPQVWPAIRAKAALTSLIG